MNGKLRFGLVAAGAIGHAYAQAFSGCTDARLTAVADTRAAAARDLATAFGCQSFSSHSAMLRRAKLDAVLVCTPPATHSEVCIDCLTSKVHVLCEKPLSFDSKTARRMISTATKHDMKLTMASKFRYVDDVRRAKAIVTSGILGDIVLFENAFTTWVDMSRRWNSDPRTSGGGVLIDNGTHSVDLMRYFLGPLSDVQVVEGKRSQGLAVEETVRIFVRSVNGVLGTVDLSWSINKEQPSYISIYGSEGTIQVGWKESRYRQSSSRDWVVFGGGYNKLQALQGNVDNFAAAIRGEEALLVTAEDALASVEVVAAAYADLHRQHWVTVGAPRPMRKTRQKSQMMRAS